MPKKKEKENSDVLEAYPLRLNVAALPDRRFFRMTHTLTITSCLLACLLVALSCFFYYAMDNQDISITYSRTQNALYRLDPESQSLKRIEYSHARVSPIQLLVEEKLTNYIINMNRITWDLEYMNSLFAPNSLIHQMTNPKIFEPLKKANQSTIANLRSKGLIRDVHLYELKLVRDNLWLAIFDTFDIPLNNNLESFCPCQDNSKECLACKKREMKSRTRYKLWIRTNLNRRKTLANPLGVGISVYSAQIVAIHDDAIFWDIPPVLRPDI